MIEKNDPIRAFEPIWKGWKIDSFIGEGSYGRVYKAVKQTRGRSYISAIKHIRVPKMQGELDQAQQLGMDSASLYNYFEDMSEVILKEVDIMFRLKGEPNIVGYRDYSIVHEKNKPQWDIFIRMEYLETLASYFRRVDITETEVIRLGVDICEALAVCKKHNVIHRDVKESNIFVDKNGRFKLGDFGIAREVSEKSRSMSMRGTPAYLAPEIARGKKYNSNVDIYSLGILLYKLMNHGRYPFMPPAPQPIRFEDTDKSLERRLSGEPLPRPATGSEQLQAAILRACSFQPQERFQNPEGFKDALLGKMSAIISVSTSNYDSEDASSRLFLGDSAIADSQRQGTRALFSSTEMSSSNDNASRTKSTSEETLRKKEESQRQIDNVEKEKAIKRGWRLIIVSSGLTLCVVFIAIVLIFNNGKAQQESHQTAGAIVTSSILPDQEANGVIILKDETAESPDSFATSLKTPSTLDNPVITTSPLPAQTQYPQPYFPLDINSAIAAHRYYALAANGDQGYIIYIQPNGKVSVNPIWETGYPFDLSQLSDWTDIIAVSASCLHVVGLKADGTVVAVGSNIHGQCYVSGWKDIVAVSAGQAHTVGLKSDGTVVATGWNEDGQCNISEWTDIVAISAGDMHTVGIKSDGTAVAKGWNYFDQCRVYPWRNIAAVAAAEHHTVGLTTNGTVVAVGQNRFGECDVSGWSDIVAIAAGTRYTIGLKSNGTVVATGENSAGQIDAITEWEDVVAIYESMGRVFGVKTDGTVLTNVMS